MISDEARAYDMTATAMLVKQGKLMVAHTTYKTLETDYQREWKQVYQSHLTEVREAKAC